MKYYYQTDSSGLLEMFKTECISASKIGMIRLSNDCHKADCNVEIDSSLLLARYVTDVGGGVMEYSLPIFLAIEKVRFIFASDDLKKNFEASATLMLTIKCLSKYRESIVVSDCEMMERRIDSDNTHCKGNAVASVVEKRFDVLKGAVVAYVCASCTSDSSEGIELKTIVRKLKNDIAGLHTQVMMDSRRSFDVESFMSRIEFAKAQYVSYAFRETNLFDILRQLFKNMVEIVGEKNAADSNPAECSRANVDDLRALEYKMQELENRFSIREKRAELRQIMGMEVENGRRNGKTRQYFKKGTPERARKEVLKLEIERFEASEEFSALQHEKNRLEGVIKPAGHESVIRALFERMSDVTTSILEAIDSSSASGYADMLQLEFDKAKLKLGMGTFDSVEMAFFNIVLENAISNPFDVSFELALMDLISESAKMFKQTDEGRTDKGTAILECLRGFRKYKQHKAFSFAIPEDMPVFGSTMAFFVKPLGSDQLDRYMLNKHFVQKKFGFMLWGACVGYSGLPKTFTNALYENMEITSQTDDFLENLLPQIIADAEQKIDIDF